MSKLLQNVLKPLVKLHVVQYSPTLVLTYESNGTIQEPRVLSIMYQYISKAKKGIGNYQLIAEAVIMWDSMS